MVRPRNHTGLLDGLELPTLASDAEIKEPEVRLAREKARWELYHEVVRAAGQHRAGRVTGIVSIVTAMITLVGGTLGGMKLHAVKGLANEAKRQGTDLLARDEPRVLAAERLASQPVDVSVAGAELQQFFADFSRTHGSLEDLENELTRPENSALRARFTSACQTLAGSGLSALPAALLAADGLSLWNRVTIVAASRAGNGEESTPEKRDALRDQLTKLRDRILLK